MKNMSNQTIRNNPITQMVHGVHKTKGEQQGVIYTPKPHLVNFVPHFFSPDTGYWIQVAQTPNR